MPTQLLLNLIFGLLALSTSGLVAAPQAVPAAVEPNASRVTATVLQHKVWQPGSLAELPPMVPAEVTHHSVELQVLTSTPVAENLSHLLEPDRKIEAFSSTPLPTQLVGSTIEAVVTLVGDHRGVRWMIKTYTPAPRS